MAPTLSHFVWSLPPQGGRRLGAARRHDIMTRETVIVPAGVPIRHPTHPGRFLDRHYLRPMALSQTRAAQLLGVSRRRVNELTQGQRAMSADTAIRCAVAFGVRADFWLALQANWDSFHAWRALRHPAQSL